MRSQGLKRRNRRHRDAAIVRRCAALSGLGLTTEPATQGVALGCVIAPRWGCGRGPRGGDTARGGHGGPPHSPMSEGRTTIYVVRGGTTLRTPAYCSAQITSSSSDAVTPLGVSITSREMRGPFASPMENHARVSPLNIVVCDGTVSIVSPS